MSTIVNVHEAQSRLPRLVEEVATGRESPVIIHGEDDHFVLLLSIQASKVGRLSANDAASVMATEYELVEQLFSDTGDDQIAALRAKLKELRNRLAHTGNTVPKRRLGIAQGKYRIPHDIDAHNSDLQRDFERS